MVFDIAIQILNEGIRNAITFNLLTHDQLEDLRQAIDILTEIQNEKSRGG